ncbi:hypothetical protein AC578_10565 [Pseudocercospora eumusae]|uniref:Uncharacterized protein n=1 Tax=Pseudocercospora eumusae TaxID=321146 RepID=A0A139H5B8_9PEZI|nr:hypothetical protein AC578_10565 [Pseudocercospora eumusae]
MRHPYHLASSLSYRGRAIMPWILALAPLVLLALWYTHRLEPPPTHKLPSIPAQNSNNTTCTSFGLLTLAAPAHPQVLWLSSRAADYAPDWLRGLGLDHGWELAGPRRTTSTAAPIWSTNALADQLAAEAGQFVMTLKRLLDRYINAASITDGPHYSLLQRALNHLDLEPWLKQHNFLPDDREDLRSALAWAYETDELARFRNAVHSGISELRSRIAHGVSHIDHEIAREHGPRFNPCIYGMDCLSAWQPDLEYLRQLAAWADFVEMNVMTSWHVADAMAFFTRYLSAQLNHSSVDMAVVQDAYRKNINPIGNRAGLYAARQWALHYSATSKELVAACGSCLTNNSAWHYWWQPYEEPATFNVTEPLYSILLTTRLQGRSEPRKVNDKYPIRAPSDFRKYKPALNGEQCLGIDHLFGVELDSQLLAKGRPSGSPFSVEYDSMKLANEMMQGKTWCIEKARLVQNRHLGLLEPAEAYNLRWVKELEQRWDRRNFVHEAWGDL